MKKAHILYAALVACIGQIAVAVEFQFQNTTNTPMTNIIVVPISGGRINKEFFVAPGQYSERIDLKNRQLDYISWMQNGQRYKIDFSAFPLQRNRKNFVVISDNGTYDLRFGDQRKIGLAQIDTPQGFMDR
jgi:hypothetical protein